MSHSYQVDSMPDIEKERERNWNERTSVDTNVFCICMTSFLLIINENNKNQQNGEW